jgi:hypothetical protein
MICTYELENFEFDYNDPWSQIPANCAWEILSTEHSILDATPAHVRESLHTKFVGYY